MPAPKKPELEKVSDLSGFMLKRRVINYIETIAEIRKAKRSDILAEIVEYYMNDHPVVFILAQQKDRIRAEAKKYREYKALYESTKKTAELRCLYFVQANYGFKVSSEKAAVKIVDAFLNDLERDTGLEPKVILDIYQRVYDEYDKEMRAQKDNADSAPQNDVL